MNEEGNSDEDQKSRRHDRLLCYGTFKNREKKTKYFNERERIKAIPKSKVDLILLFDPSFQIDRSQKVLEDHN